MSISSSRVLNGLHPWLAERVKFLGDVIEFYGGVQIYLSGTRTRSEQQRLYDTVLGRPVAAPGCSQHQYGYAADVAWGALLEQSALGGFSPRELAEAMTNLGRQVGLVVVRGDPGHFQIFPGSEFRTWAVASGFCNPNPPPSANQLRLARERLQDLQDDEGLFGPIAVFGENFFRRGFVF